MMKKKEEGKQTLMGKKHSTLYFFFTISSVYGWIEDDDDDDDDDELIIASPTISICKEYGSLLEPFFLTFNTVSVAIFTDDIDIHKFFFSVWLNENNIQQQHRV